MAGVANILRMPSLLRRAGPQISGSFAPQAWRRHLNSFRTSHSSATATPRPIAALLQATVAEEWITVDGFVRSVRSQKRHSFVSLGDGSSLDALQAVVPADLAQGLAIGAAVRLQGSWGPSPGRGQSHELQVTNAEVLGPSDARTFPIQKKYQTPEYLRTLPHMRPRIPFNAVVLRFRSELISSLTRFFEGRRFVQVHTPILTSSDCEGAGEVFNITTEQSGDGNGSESGSGSGGNPETASFFRRPVYTTVSSQLHLEALAQSMGHVWTLSPTFRAEHSDTPRHLSEFYMLEAEMSFTDNMAAVMDLVEDMLKHIVADMSQHATFEELTREQGRSADLAPAEEVRRRWDGLLDPAAWPRITYTEAIELLKKTVADQNEQFEHEPIWGKDLHTEHEKWIAATVGKGSTPVFITNYPKDIKAFYMKGASVDTNSSFTDGASSTQTVECFDLLVPEFCEIAGGSMREHRLEELVQAMRAKGMPTGAAENSTEGSATAAEIGDGSNDANGLDWYLDLRRWGCPPHGGFGLGFDRLLCYLTGVQTIRDTTAFPRWYGRCDC
ncbi:asparaginyl-tRNA synthetase [Microdochium nivale]|nr:asparaginyl-tRNA synthetase [Microdochium nivale]